MNYWARRQEQLNRQLEKDETELKKRLSAFYESESRKLEKEIAAFYQKYGTDSILEYRALMESLSVSDKKLLIERIEEFVEKYPEYEDLVPIRKNIYKLNRLEGIQYSIKMQQLEMGAITNAELKAHLEKQAMRGVNAAAEAMGFGKKFYFANPDIIKRFVNIPWCNGKNFSQRIWDNVDKLANYLNTDISQAFARGDSYDKIVRNLLKRFGEVSRNDAYRLIYNEGTYVMAESTMQPFEEEFEKYKISTVGDGKVCNTCRGISEKIFEIKDRIPGVNFPPLHTWCRCSFEIVVEDWDAWMDGYVKKHGEGTRSQAEKIAERVGGDLMKLSIPDGVYKASGMSQETKIKIERAIKALESEYNIYIDRLEGEHCGRKEIFLSGGFIDDDGVLKHSIVFNYDIDYEKVERSMRMMYNKGKLAGKNYEDYIAHEIAHILPFQNCVTAEEYKELRRELKKQFIPGISEYADRTQDGAESLAEAFVKYRNGEEIPDEAKELIARYISPWRR